MSEENQEKVSDIVAEFREVAKLSPDGIIAVNGNVIADRLEAAWKREKGLAQAHCNLLAMALEHHKNKKPTGDSAAMREALVKARDALSSAEKYVYGNPPNGGSLGWNDVWPAEWHNALEAVESALAEPPRNCDRSECKDTTSAQFVWAKEDGGKTAYYDWLLAPAEEGDAK